MTLTRITAEGHHFSACRSGLDFVAEGVLGGLIRALAHRGPIVGAAAGSAASASGGCAAGCGAAAAGASAGCAAGCVAAAASASGGAARLRLIRSSFRHRSRTSSITCLIF